MSTVENSQANWQNREKTLDSKYEKCRNITEEIYKRINITFQIKKLEAGSDLSDNSEQLDSNELSNETDLFACDKSDISSSSAAEKPPTDCVKFININNNEEKKKPQCKRLRKRFRKRVKKRPQRAHSDSEGSSDEAPLSRIVEIDTRIKRETPDSPDACMGVPNVLILTTDLKPKLPLPEKKPTKREIKKETPDKKDTINKKDTICKKDTIDKKDTTDKKESVLSVTDDKDKLKEKGGNDLKSCNLCSLTFRGERGLRRHMSMSHVSSEDCK